MAAAAGANDPKDAPTALANLSQLLVDIIPRIADVTAANKETAAGIARQLARYRDTVTSATTPKTTMTTLPTPGAKDTPPTPRDYKLDKFKGDFNRCQKDPQICLGWLQEITSIMAVEKLTEDAAKDFLLRNVSRRALTLVQAAMDRKESLQAIIVELETTFAGLRPPEEALRMCRTLTMKRHESPAAFGLSVEFYAKMACRDKSNPAEATEQLAKDCFLAGLEPNLQTAFKSELEMRRRLGEQELNFHALMQDAVRKQQTLKTMQRAQRERSPPSRSGGRSQLSGSHVHFSAAIEDASDISDEEQTSDSDENEELEGERECFAVTQKNRNAPPVRYRDLRNGKAPPAPTRENKKKPDARRDEAVFQVSAFDDDNSVAIYQITGEQRAKSERIRFEDLNISTGECAKCGLRGHYAFGESAKACPLRAEILQRTPCPNCKKGGHLANKCIRKLNFEITGN